MDCVACKKLFDGTGGYNQEEHYGGCIPDWVETEDVWAILSDPSEDDMIEKIEVLDIDTDHDDSDSSMSE